MTELGATDPDNGDGVDAGEADALISRLRVIEAQPLADRAAAFSQLYDTLQSVLGGGSGGGGDGAGR
ncbi:hypothetical protein [Parafrigoribacterium mesophilum]|uniref:hypothetical protein n=1 Tax=Parafrigoribacterium mesophilum TaxID=433646 RepID=UPI0031FC0CD3